MTWGCLKFVFFSGAVCDGLLFRLNDEYNRNSLNGLGTIISVRFGVSLDDFGWP